QRAQSSQARRRTRCELDRHRRRLRAGSKRTADRGGAPPLSHGTCYRDLRRLRLDRIDLYQLHTVDRKVPMEASLGALKEMQDVGKIRHVGLSNVDPE